MTEEDFIALRVLVKRTCHTPLLVAGRFVAIFEHDKELVHRSTIATEAEMLLALEHEIRTLQLANVHLRTQLKDPSVLTSVLDEMHDFQRFEHRTRGRDGQMTRQLKILCRCGWSADWIDQDPDEKIAVVAARDLLGVHITEAIDRAFNHKERT